MRFVDQLTNALDAMGCPDARSVANLVAEVLDDIEEDLMGEHTVWRRRILGASVIRFTRGIQVQWPRLLLYVAWTRHKMPTRRP